MWFFEHNKRTEVIGCSWSKIPKAKKGSQWLCFESTAEKELVEWH